MESLSPSQIGPWLLRFEHFFDAVLREFSVEFPYGKAHSRIEIESRDNLHEGWSRVEIHLQEITACRWDVPMNTAYNILSNGLHLMHEEGLFYFDLGYFVDAPGGAAQYSQSGFYFAAKEVSWSANEMV